MDQKLGIPVCILFRKPCSVFTVFFFILICIGFITRLYGGTYKPINIHAKLITGGNKNNDISSTCESLLRKGHFRNATTWEAQRNCTLHKYDARDAGQCLMQISQTQNRSSYISFLGDSRIRYQYWALTKLLNGGSSVFPMTKYIENYTYITNNNIIVEYHRLTIPEEIYKHILKWDAMDHPNFILAGSALHTLRNNYLVKDLNSTLNDYTEYLKKISKAFHRLRNKNHIIWQFQDPVNVFDMIRTKKYFANNDMLEIMNDIAIETLADHIVLWSSSRLVAQQFINDTYGHDGIHNNVQATELNIQILLNHLCNQYMDILQPNTCCSHAT